MLSAGIRRRRNKMSDTSKEHNVRQESITTGGGDVVAGDKTSIYFNQQPTGTEYLTHLYDKLSKEIYDSKQVQETCDILKEFIATNEDEVIGLEKKLERGGMQYQAAYAKSCKERYAKNLTKFSMFESAQVIHAYLLGKVESGYAAHVLPELARVSAEQKFALMRKAVLDPIEASIGSNPLGLHSPEIDGMAYFLTGKCRLKWER